MMSSRALRLCTYRISRMIPQQSPMMISSEAAMEALKYHTPRTLSSR